MTKLSLATRRVINRLSQLYPDDRRIVERHVRKLDRELGRHRAASVALVVADAKGEADSHTDWNDVDAARELAEEALGAKAVKRIRKQVRAALGGDEDEAEDESEE